MFPFPPSDPRRTRVKICGVTHPDDAALAVSLGADALGLNFYPPSPRCLDPARDAPWLRELAGAVPRVGVLVNPTRAEIDALLAGDLIDSVQLHGDEDAAFCGALAEAGIPYAKALRVRDETSLRGAGGFHTPWIVLDAFHSQAYGGTGLTMDWSLAERAVAAGATGDRYRVILSGGLGPGNVAGAVRRVRPFGVDVASGVEVTGDRRRKDAARLRDFFSEVRSADAS